MPMQAFAFAPQKSTARIPTNLQDSFIDDPVMFATKRKPTLNTMKHGTHSHRVNNLHASKDWLHNIASLPRSTVLRDILNPVMTVTGWSFVISVVHRLMRMSSLPLWNQMAINMCIPTHAHSCLVSSLGLLLVFRTNSAYQRFLVSLPESVNALSTPSTSTVCLTTLSIGKRYRKEERFGNRYYQHLATSLVCLPSTSQK